MLLIPDRHETQCPDLKPQDHGYDGVFQGLFSSCISTSALLSETCIFLPIAVPISVSLIRISIIELVGSQHGPRGLSLTSICWQERISDMAFDHATRL
jgi:hypothetical protein